MLYIVIYYSAGNEFYYYITFLIREPVGLLDGYSLYNNLIAYKYYYVGRVIAISLVNNYISEIV
jgi:hypothetical protein